MRLRILHKVFLTLVLSAGSALVVMVLLVQWSLGRGFLDYLNQVEAERVDDLGLRLAERYEASGSWDGLTRREWDRLTRDGRGRLPPRNRPGEFVRHRRQNNDNVGDGTARHSSAEVKSRADDTRPEDDRRRPPPDGRPNRDRRYAKPPPPPRPATRGLLELGPRLNLFDSAQSPLIGRSRRIDDADYRKEISVGDNIVGWLTLTPVKQLRAVREVSFLRQQLVAFSSIAAVLLLGVALLAIGFARHLTQPLSQLAANVRQLVRGDYGLRTGASGNDEIAELSRDIDTLARTLDDNRQSRRRWIADISHELRTPLTVLRGELEALKDGVRTVNGATIDSLHAEAMRLGDLVNDLHELSLSDLGALTYQMGRLDLKAVLDEAAELFQSRLRDHGLELDYKQRHSDQSWPVMGDRSRLLQLFGNLLENSLRYTDAGGRTVITVHGDAERVIVEISDTAPTVAAAECARLFERLYRGDPSRARVAGGSGLGLAICKNIVDAHAGQLAAAPSPLGGLSISIELPVN